MKKIRSIGLKYCGGCNPRYDRAEAVRRIREELGGTVRFAPPDDPDVDSILAIMGCETACADLNAFSGKKIWIITSRKEADNWVAERKKAL
ncbi:MAG TPA: hypothetical protein PLA82_03095 [Deltaproteobacteria bacterium]|nr:hypothetical protein [Deltaproteobacteria bacterium]